LITIGTPNLNTNFVNFCSYESCIPFTFPWEQKLEVELERSPASVEDVGRHLFRRRLGRF